MHPIAAAPLLLSLSIVAACRSERGQHPVPARSNTPPLEADGRRAGAPARGAELDSALMVEHA